MPRRSLTLVLALFATRVAALSAQGRDSVHEWKSSTGSVLTQRGDTVWWSSPRHGLQEQAVRHGQIVELTFDRKAFKTVSTWEIQGDSARCLLYRDSTGATRDAAHVRMRSRDILNLFESVANERRMDALGMFRRRPAP